ncbi:class F sortase, partial [Arthrobacter sp. SO3]|uniref:class F sortase n=1 Tax=Arthrobacter sp. SO3 TaxID=1897057 RepID=UPI001CFFA5C8
MSRHRQIQRRRLPGIRGQVLSPRDMLILTVCVLGLITAWLFYAASGAGAGAGAGAGTGNGQPAFGQAAGTSLTGSSGPPASSSGPAPGGTSAGMLPVGESAAQPAAQQPLAPEPPAQGPAASVPHRILYQAAGMDVAVRPLEPDSGDVESRSIVPPETMDGYWLTPFGRPGAGSANTTYVIGHSWEGLDAPFNHLSTAAAPGDTITVATETGELRYAVDSVTTYTKSTLKDSLVWDAVPNRLVLISCYTADPWGKNVVVVASPAVSYTHL